VLLLYLRGFECAHECIRHNTTYLLKTFTEVGQHTRDMPAKMERDFLISCSIHLQANSSGDTVGMRHQPVHVNAQVMRRVRIGLYTHIVKDQCAMVVPEEMKRSMRRVTEDTKGLKGRNT
jgi:hypothetical protein